MPFSNSGTGSSVTVFSTVSPAPSTDKASVSVGKRGKIERLKSIFADCVTQGSPENQLDIWIEVCRRGFSIGGGSSGSQVVLLAKTPSANAGNIRGTDLILGSGRFTGEEHGNPLHYSCLEKPMDRGAWWD